MRQFDDVAVERPSPRVLVVEDEALIRLAIADLLRHEGFVVLEAQTADDAIDLLAAGKTVDVIFSDVQMPGETNGVELARLVETRFPLIPVVLTSANEPADTLGLPFLPKPYRDDEVVSIVRMAMEDRSGNCDTTGWPQRGDGGGWRSSGPQ